MPGMESPLAMPAITWLGVMEALAGSTEVFLSANKSRIYIGRRNEGMERNFNVKIIIRNLIFLLSPHSGLFPDSSSSMAPEVTIIHTAKMKLYTIINSQLSLCTYS